MNEVEEFAIPRSIIKFDYLTSISKIIKNIDFEDMCGNPSLSDFTQLIYNQDNNIVKSI